MSTHECIRIIRKACIEANPDIVKLQPGCEVKDDIYGRGVIIGVRKGLELETEIYDVWYEGRDDGITSPFRQTWEIVGRDIRLSDVLMAIDKVEAENEGDTPCVTPDGQFIHYDAENGSMLITGIFYDLRADRPEDQSLECQRFLAKLFIKK